MRTLKDYLLVGEAAKFLGVSVGTIRNWDRSGKLQSYRNPANGYRLFKRSDLEAFLASIAEERTASKPSRSVRPVARPKRPIGSS